MFLGALMLLVVLGGLGCFERWVNGLLVDATMGLLCLVLLLDLLLLELILTLLLRLLLMLMLFLRFYKVIAPGSEAFPLFLAGDAPMHH